MEEFKILDTITARGHAYKVEGVFPGNGSEVPMVALHVVDEHVGYGEGGLPVHQMCMPTTLLELALIGGAEHIKYHP